ncbi:YrrC family ATP-dependent DNA helicase [Acidisoma cladoniae]|uniref:YrrC family ATP-dependent DNA helicase n=1 Tax=Acidisoma cladoniae TaxID=3040935 RepID=UPI003D9CA23C
MAHPARHRENRPETLPSTAPKIGCRAITPGLSLRLDEKRGSRHVLRVKSRGPRDFVVVKGNAATISVGKSISTIGNWVNDRDHGLQF